MNKDKLNKLVRLEECMKFISQLNEEDSIKFKESIDKLDPNLSIEKGFYEICKLIEEFKNKE